MMNENYYWGMHLIWWAVWLMLLFWIFAIPRNIPGQRHRKETAYMILQKRFASGQITAIEYNEMKKVLDLDILSD